MTPDRETLRIIGSWMEDGRTRLPEHVLDAVLDQLPSTPQRRPGWRARRISHVNGLAKFAIAAVVAVVAALLGFNFLRGPVVGPAASPSPASPTFDAVPQGEWSATGGMVQRRTEGHSVTLLDDGRVLVAGGGGSRSGATRTAELYDPATGTWSATGDMTGARYDQSATLLRDGRVLVAGGSASFATEQVLASAELYDPSTGTWTAAASMTEARQGPTATLLLDGRVLIAGGQQWVPDDSGAHMVDLASAELYDPVTGLWTATTEMPEPRDVSTATLLLDGRVLFVGASAQLYDPATESWTPTARMAQSHGAHTATLLRDGRVLVAGVGFPLRRDAELYDPQANSWTQTGDMNEGRAWFAAGLLPDGTVLVTGSGDGGYGGSPTAERYDPGTGTWRLTPNMLSEHGYHQGVTLNDGRFLVVGGFGPLGEPSAETYDVSR